MANVLNTDKQIAIIAALAEGSSIRSIERMAGIHRDTIYAWTHATDDPDIPKRSVTVLHVPPAISPITAVRVAIMQELKEMRVNADSEA